MEKSYVGWNEVEQFVENLTEKIRNADFKPSGVFGFPKGGLIPAVMISHKLDIPLLSSPSNNCIIVDDIVDTGETMLHYYYKRGGFFTTSIIAKPNQYGIVPKYFLFDEKQKPGWVVFPWEHGEEND